MKKKQKNKQPFNVRVVQDWEERLSLFLQEAIDQPHLEPEVCEALIEYVQFLMSAQREVARRALIRAFEAVL